jgi:type VI protein secretion system component VasF
MRESFERDPELLRRHLRPEEAEAIRILWRFEGHEDPVPSEEALRLLYAVRSRQAEIEDTAITLATEIARRSRMRARFQLFASLLFLGVVGVLAITYLLLRT